MNKYCALLFLTIQFMQAQEVKVTSGKVTRIENFKSQFVDARNVDVWLPNGYNENEKYAVLYMHDGQMLLDPETTWNKQSWRIDSTAGKLIKEKRTQKFIVVGISNNGMKRHPEYFPQQVYQPFDSIQKKFISDILIKKGKINTEFKPISDQYLKFMVLELKPYIDSHFSTLSDQKHTFIAGSSMGGLISLYAICEYPEVFGGAACLSTHWTGIYQLENNPIPDALLLYLKTHLPNPKNHQLYFDCGSQTLDTLYPSLQLKVDNVLKCKGFSKKNWMTKFFPGENHSEQAWRKRLDIPLLFLLGK